MTITVNPHDAMAAMPTGRRMHKPIRIVREIDAASPKFFTISHGDLNNDGTADVTISL